MDMLPDSLPGQLTSFVGRGAELVEIERLLVEQRLVTLAGPGGCGKTRLAVRAAADLADGWPDGVRWVDFGSISDAGLVVGVTAQAAEVLVDPAADSSSALVAQLRGRRMLLCLDTCEHVLEGVATMVDRVLRACPGVAVLAISREPLGISGETVWRVPPLVEEEAVRLFADRAALASSGFTVEGREAEVRTICGRLDGIPLAIELAAPWVRVLSVGQIAAGLRHRFQLLTEGPRVALPRQRTLAASMEWSHELLADDERAVFRRLAVFAGGFTLDAARAVCAGRGDVLAVLGRLVDKSLVIANEGATEFRYRLLDTVREYAEQQLHAAGEEAAVRDLHLGFFLELAEGAEPELDRDQDAWRQVLDGHRDNIRAALRWGLAAGDPERGRRLAAAMARQWFIRGQAHEGIEFLDRAIDRAADERSVLQARLLCGWAMMGMLSGRWELTGQAAERGLEIATENGDDRVRARCRLMTAYRPFFFDFERCAALCLEAETLGAATGDPFARDWAAVVRAFTFITRDRHDEAAALARSAYDRSEPRGDRFCAAFARCAEMYVSLYTGRVGEAVVLGEEAMSVAAPLREYFALGTITAAAAVAHGMAGDTARGRKIMEVIVRSVDEAPDVDVVGFQPALGWLHLWDGDLDGAVSWFERGTRFTAPDADNWTTARCRPGLAGALRRLGRFGPAREEAARAVALARAFGGPLVLAQALDEQAFLTAEDDPGRAAQVHHEALALRLASGLRTFWVDSLDALAHLAAGVDAVRLYAASDTARGELGYPRPAVDVPVYESRTQALRAALSTDEFDAAWAEGAALPLDDAVAWATRARGARGRPASGWGSLTPTERTVVRLVSDGLTNPEIARRLFVSRATVKTHLLHIYAKLDVANRTELSSRAAARERHPDE